MRTIYLDNSTLETVAKCDTATILGAYNELASRSESAPLIAGQAAHEALALHFQGVSSDMCLAKFNELYYDVGYSEWPESRLHATNLYAIMKNWLETHPLTDWPFYPVVEGIEKPLSHVLYTDHHQDIEVIFVGLLDTPVCDKRDGQLSILDHKTTGRVDDTWKSSFRLKSQVDGYLWLAQRTWPDANVHTMYINAIEFSKVPNSTRKCATHGVAYKECGIFHPRHELFSVSRTQDQINSWHQTVCRLAQRYIELTEVLGDLQWADVLDQQGRFNGACQYCQFKLFCEQSRPVNMIESLFIHHPWRSLLEEKVRAHASR